MLTFVVIKITTVISQKRKIDSAQR